MTKRERDAVVELLRCAADNLSPTSTGAWTDALEGLDATFEIEMAASRAFGGVAEGRTFSKRECETGRALYLEAALRVEQGEWP